MKTILLHKNFYSIKHLWILLSLNVCYGFYLPGLAPVSYCRDSEASPNCKVSVILLKLTLYFVTGYVV